MVLDSALLFWATLYIVNTGIIEQAFQCAAKVVLLAKIRPTTGRWSKK